MWRAWEDKHSFNQPAFLGVRWSRAVRLVFGSKGALLRLIILILAFLFSPPLSAVDTETPRTSSQVAPKIDDSSSSLQKMVRTEHEGLSRQQGDAILRELRSIRTLLQQQQTATKSRKRPTSASIKLSEHPSLGQVDAPVIMVEFTDYQCPYCKQFHDTTFPRLKEKYIDTGKLRYVAMDLPLRFHQQARPAAHAARCAADQGKFWQMRKTLFANSRALGQEALLKYAGDLSLDTTIFSNCLQEKRHDPVIQRDIKTANGAGFSGTPSFVIGKNLGDQVNGVALIGAKPLAEFEKHIQRLLPTQETGR